VNFACLECVSLLPLCPCASLLAHPLSLCERDTASKLA
jgi:hypothetical protein